MPMGFIISHIFARFWIAAPATSYSNLATYPLALAPKTMKTTGGGSILVDFQSMSNIISYCQTYPDIYWLTSFPPLFGLPLPPLPTPVWPPIPWSLLVKQWKQLEVVVYSWTFNLWVMPLAAAKMPMGFIIPPIFAQFSDCLLRRCLLCFDHLSSLGPCSWK